MGIDLISKFSLSFLRFTKSLIGLFLLNILLIFFLSFKSKTELIDELNPFFCLSNLIWSNNIFFEADDSSQFKSFKEIFKKTFSSHKKYNVNFTNISSEGILNTAYKLVHFGWKNEAIPITKSKKSKIARFFHTIFG